MNRTLPLALLLAAALPACATAGSRPAPAPEAAPCVYPHGTALTHLPDGSSVAEAFAAAAEHAAQSAGGRTVYGVPGASEPALANQRQVARSIAHHYPRRLVRKKKEGVVSLFVLIGADGRAADVLVLRPAGEPELDAAAVQVVPEMRFHPSRAGGCAVPAFAEIALTFTLDRDFHIRILP